jgi:hypothetical protein
MPFVRFMAMYNFWLLLKICRDSANTNVKIHRNLTPPGNPIILAITLVMKDLLLGDLLSPLFNLGLHSFEVISA